MQLRGRFTLWFSLAALVPIAVAALVTRDVVSRSYTADFEKLRDATKKNVEHELERLEQSVTRFVEEVVDDDQRHPLIGGVLLELQKTGGELSVKFQRKLRNDGKNYRRVLGLDALFVLDSEDRVLVSPHHQPAHNTSDDVHAQRERAANGRAYYVHETTMNAGQVAQKLMVEAARVRRQGRHHVTVVGGLLIDDKLLDVIRQSERIDARIIDTRNRVLVPSERPWETESVYLISIPLSDPQGQPAAIIQVIISKSELARVLEQVTIAALVLAFAALLITILLGAFVARRMTANLDRLIEGAQAAARGDLHHRVSMRSKDEIGELARSFNAMMEDLETSKERLVMAERIAAWQEIARRLAHEIKNPLTPIQMSVETMRKCKKKQHPSFDEIFEESTVTILEETARLKRIVGEFAEFARMPKPMLMPIDLSEAVTNCLGLYQGTTPIKRDLSDSLPPILADRDQLSQMLLNLLENARDAIESRSPDDSAAPGRITISTRANERSDRVEIVIEDNGPGIPDNVKDKLFTPYFTTKQGGTGLGLAIVHRMVSDHGGRISITDAVGGGARFQLEFPASDEAIELPIKRSST